jgi:hypothetical protein
MPKIIYSSYHFTVKKINIFEIITISLFILMLCVTAWCTAMSRRSMSYFYFIKRNRPLDTLILIGIIAVVLFLIILFSFFSAIHFVLTDEKLYLYNPLYPFSLRTFRLTDIKLIEMKAEIVNKEKSSFRVHLKNDEQFIYTMPWGNKEQLQEKLKDLKVTLV